MTTTTRDDVYVLELQSDNANAIDEPLLEQLANGLAAARDDRYAAVVLTGYDRFFSAGLNLKGLPEDRAGMESFIDRFEAANLELLRFPRPVVAAVNGHAIAGGCVLACTADVRIGADARYKLGVSEVALGISFPATAFEIMRHTLSARWVPDVLLGGELLSPADACDAGILHRVVPEGSLLDEAVSKAAALADKPRAAFVHSKLQLREPMLERIAASAESSRRDFLDSWFSEDVVARRKAMLQ